MENNTGSNANFTGTVPITSPAQPNSACPNCGYCPHCGRGSGHWHSYPPYYLPYCPPYYPYVTWCGTIDGSTATGTFSTNTGGA